MRSRAEQLAALAVARDVLLAAAVLTSASCSSCSASSSRRWARLAWYASLRSLDVVSSTGTAAPYPPRFPVLKRRLHRKRCTWCRERRDTGRDMRSPTSLPPRPREGFTVTIDEAALAAELLARHGVTTTARLATIGIGRRAIDRLKRSGRLAIAGRRGSWPARAGRATLEHRMAVAAQRRAAWCGSRRPGWSGDSARRPTASVHVVLPTEGTSPAAGGGHSSQLRSRSRRSTSCAATTGSPSRHLLAPPSTRHGTSAATTSNR